MRADRNENVVFDEWQGTNDPVAKGMLQAELMGLLKKHASALVYLHMGHERRPDIVNAAVLRVLTRSSTFQGKSLFSTWFHTVVENLIRSAQKTEYSRNEVALEDVPETVVSQRTSVEAKMLLKELEDGLDANDRMLLQMKLNGNTQEEIAEALNIPESEQVGIMWRRLKERLRTTSGVKRVMAKSENDGDSVPPV